MGLGEPAPSLGTQVPHLRGCLAGTAYDLMLMGSVLCHVRLGAVGSSNDSEEAQGLRGRVVPGAEPLFSVLDFLKEPVRLYLSTAGLGGGAGGMFPAKSRIPPPNTLPLGLELRLPDPELFVCPPVSLLQDHLLRGARFSQ